MKSSKFLWPLLVLSSLIASCGGSNSQGSNSSSSASASGSETLTSSFTSGSSSPTTSDEVGGDVDYSSIIFRFRGDGIQYKDYALWIWEDGYDGALFIFNDSDDFGGYIELPASTWVTRSKLNYIIRPALSWSGQSADIFIYLADFAPYMVDGVIQIFLLQGETDYFFTQADALGDRVLSASFTNWTTVRFETTANFVSYELLENDLPIRSGTAGSSGQLITLENEADLSKLYRVKVKFLDTDTKFKYRSVSATPLFSTSTFENDFTYLGDDLGLTFTSTHATFKVWAPTSSTVKLKLYSSGTPASISGLLINDIPLATYPMVRGEQGTFSVSLELTAHRGLFGRYYTYTVTNALGTNEVVDPYAKATGVNGGRALILDFSTTDPEEWSDVTFSDIASPTDLQIYELHVRDLTADATWTGTEKNRGKYLGLIEEGTTYSDMVEGDLKTVSTGFDHLKELGVNAIQLLPFFDQANNEMTDTYNWGYNPLNYNVLEGGYSSDPLKGEVRVKEFKRVVQTFAQNDIRIVMDVVYNHVASATGSNFNMLVPGYYFRLNDDGTYSDGAGVGNETKSERPMFRKFIVDSVSWWASEYKIKGFRFDLMALIDTTTMMDVRSALSSIDPDIVVYGEPWKGYSDSTLPNDQQSNTYSVYNRLNGIAAFNDRGRDGIRGENTWSGNQWGWMAKGESDNSSNTQWLNSVKGMMAGRVGDYYTTSYVDPSKTINYASVHDNLTLYDQLVGTVDVTDAPKVSVGINAIVSFSLGIPLIHAGEEIMRSKVAAEDDLPETYYTINGVNISHNSYRSPDSTNAFQWNRKINFESYFQQYCAFIALRKTLSVFKYSTAAATATGIDRKMGFWDGPLAYSTLGAWYLDPHDGTPYYVFANAREQVTLGAFTSQLTWDSAGAKVEVLFDSIGQYSPGTQLTNSVLLLPYQVLLVKRLV